MRYQPSAYLQRLSSLRQTQSLPILLLLFICSQISVSLFTQGWDFDRWAGAHEYLDSTWFIHLATNGYTTPTKFPAADGSEFAFFPMWPMILTSVSFITGAEYLQLKGLIISLVFFTATLLIICRKPSERQIQGDSREVVNYLYARNLIVAFPLVFNPGSWVYLSNHTEAFFLFLSVFAFHQAYKGNLYVSSILAGLASVTRNQGVVVAFCIGLYFLLNKNRFQNSRVLSFFISGSISASFYFMWLAFLFYKTGNIFASMEAQKHWSIIESFGHYVSNLLWLSPRNALRALIFWTILISSIVAIKRSKQRMKIIPIATYLILSVLLWPLQGNNFPQAFRFGAVLFPFWLLVGARLEDLIHSQTKTKTLLAFILFVFLVFMFFRVTYYYFTKTNWPY